MFLDIAKKRFSSRKYASKPVEQEKILQVLEAARIAPSAANVQPWTFYVFTSREGLNSISEIYHRQWFKESPVVIVACADHSKGWVRATDKKNHCDIDLGIAIDHMTLAAADLDLGTCWICNFDVEKCRQVLELKENIEPVALLTLAYPLDSSDTERFDTARKKLDEIVIWK